MRVVAFTSAATNYLPKVRLLFQSLREHHPEFKLVLALADETMADADLSNEPLDEVISVGDLDIPDKRQWIFFHTIVELSTAIKPFVLKELLRREDADLVLYFDPDMVVFDRLDDLISAMSGKNVGLTPHQTRPEVQLEAVRDNEISSLKHGVYNLGFLAVGNTSEGRRFAVWWAERIYHFCVADIPNGLFTDQRWVDLAPAFFDGVQVLKNPRYNVATWNLTTRTVTGNAEQGFQVDGEPLGFYHFTGFDSGAHAVMAAKNAPANDSVKALVEWYRAKTRFDSADPYSSVPWAFANYPDGSPIPLEHRRLYRDRPDLQSCFPDPLLQKDCGLKRWMETQGMIEHPERLKKNSLGA